MAAVVVDTNVASVASELSEQAAPECVLACVDALLRIQDEGGLLLDNLGDVLLEYTDALGYAGKPGVGRAFVKWVFDHESDERLIRRIRLTPRTDGGWRRYEEFPADQSLRRFHGDDQKFAAIAIASGENPDVLNAVDSDWWKHRAALQTHGVRVQFLCPGQFKGE